MKLKETEGTPIMQSEEQWKKSFLQQRKNRLQDSVDEYMQDCEVDAFFKDLRSAIQDLIDYHGKQKESAQTLMKVVSGHRPFDFQVDTSLDDVEMDDDKYFQRKMQQNKPPGPAVDEEGRQLTEDEYFKWKYNLAEADYYDKRAQLDADYEQSKSIPERY